MGLGPLHDVSLAEARTAAHNCRLLLREGRDPIDHRAAKREEGRLERAGSRTFSDCADAYLSAHRSGWKNSKHSAQWEATLRAYAYPVFGNLSVQAIDTNLVLKVLEPIWTSKTETASRVRGRVEAILDWATVRKYRSGDNPARWKGHLDKLLPRRSRVRSVTHFAALPYPETSSFIRRLRQLKSISARALEFAILTAARTGEVLGATWDEIDLESRVWIVPANRMKAGREHRVPLPRACMEIVREMKAITDGDFLFPGGRRGKPLSNMAFLQLLKRLGRSDLTAHGFRSTFRDWASEQTPHSHEVIEMALAHTISNKVEAAYRRGDLFEKRRKLLEDWAQYLDNMNSVKSLQDDPKEAAEPV